MPESSSDRNRTIERVLAQIRAGQLDAAEQLCGQLTAGKPDDPAVHQLAATVAFQRGRLEDAGRWIDSSLALRPDHPPSLTLSGRIARAVGDLPRATARFRRANLLSPSQPEAAFQLCAILLQQRDQEAQLLLARLLVRFPAEADGWREIGDTLQAVGQAEAAATAYARAAGNSSDPKHQVRLGLCLKSLGRLDGAVTAFQQALNTAPAQFEVRLMLGSCLRQIGKSDLAIAEFERATEINGMDSRGWFSLGNACDDVRDRDGAIAAYRKAVQLLPALPEAHVNLGLDLQHAGDLTSALDSYRKAIALRPSMFGRITQALTSAKTGQLWLNLDALRNSLGG
jgi:tetratricopeptide (TPR) repeat protein